MAITPISMLNACTNRQLLSTLRVPSVAFNLPMQSSQLLFDVAKGINSVTQRLFEPALPWSANETAGLLHPAEPSVGVSFCTVLGLWWNLNRSDTYRAKWRDGGTGSHRERKSLNR